MEKKILKIEMSVGDDVENGVLSSEGFVTEWRVLKDCISGRPSH